MPERNMQLQDWLDDLCVRFLMNGPKEDLETAERICFRVEEAQWYYEDFIRPMDPTLPSMTLKQFCEEIFTHCPLLSPFSQDHRREAFDAFLSYKKRVPVRGAILLNRDMDKVVLVKGWKKGANWSFPRGKINKDEDDLDCAIREVYEETGFDLGEAGFVPADRQVKSIDLNMREQQIRLFVFRDIPMDTHFEPRTRKEISAIHWWRLSDLPAFRKKKTQAQQPIDKANNFYMVAPFLTHLRKWIVDQKHRKSNHGTESNIEAFPQGKKKTDIYTEKAPLGGPSASSNQYLISAQSAQHSQGQSQQFLNGNTGSALLALLHSKTKSTSHKSPQDFSVRPPNYKTEPSCVPSSSLDQDPRASYFQMNEPSDDESVVYQQPPIQPTHIGLQYSRMIEAQKHIQATQQKRNFAGPHPNQPQHLIHPQPLPPHVQRTIFVQSPVPLSPLVPKIATKPEPISNKSSQSSQPHVPKITELNKQGSLKLTNHTLALLNSFRNRDSRDDEEFPSKDHSVQRYSITPDTEYMYNNLPAVPTPPVRQKAVEQETHTNTPISNWNPISLQPAHNELNYAQQQELEMARRRAAREQGLLQESDHCNLQDIWRQASMKDDVNRNKIRNHHSNDYQHKNHLWNNQNGSLAKQQSFERHEFVNQRSQLQSSETPSPQNRHPQQNNQGQTYAPYRQHEHYISGKLQHSYSSSSPQELSTSSSRAQQTSLNAGFLFPQHVNEMQQRSPETMIPRQHASERQKIALLGLFRNSDIAKAESTQSTSSKAHSMKQTPPAVELSAFETVPTGAPRTSEPTIQKWSADHLGHVPEINPETNLPFRALTILSRPPDVINQPELHSRRVSTQPISLNNKQGNPSSGNRRKSATKLSPNFKPQILKRQSSKLQFSESSNRLPPKTGRFSESPKDREYNYNQSADHKQNMVSLFDFKAPSPPPHNPANNRFSLPTVTDAYTSYGLKSFPTVNNIWRKRNSSISPENKCFLLNYLNAVIAKGAHC